MTLDEAIAHCEEVADYDWYNDTQCKCAEEHRQLAEWLGELKQLKERDSKKYRCELGLYAEGETTGMMMLTEEEYNIVKRVANISNWDELQTESWSGAFFIYCEELEDDN